jgi:hypothetical protein
MSPVENFYYGLGLVMGSVITLIVWALSKFIFNTDVSPGLFSGVIAIGLYFIYTGIMKGRNNV